MQHAAQVIGRDGLDLTVDPPPDVVVEVDVSHSSTAKLRFWAELGIPEVWRHNGDRIVMYERSGEGYVEIPASLAFPSFTAEALTGLLDRIKSERQQAVLHRLPPFVAPLMHPIYDELIDATLRECQRHYGARLVSVGAFGSVGRGTPTADSDIDLLIVAEGLPRGRLARSDDFVAVEKAMAPDQVERHQ